MLEIQSTNINETMHETMECHPSKEILGLIDPREYLSSINHNISMDKFFECDRKNSLNKSVWSSPIIDRTNDLMFCWIPVEKPLYIHPLSYSHVR